MNKENLIKTGHVITALGSLFFLNQYLVRFYQDTDLLKPLLQSEMIKWESDIFHHDPTWYILYIVASCLALFIAPRILKGGLDNTRFYSLCFVVATTFIGISGFIISQSIGNFTLGGETILFYWAGFMFVMMTSSLMAFYAWKNNYMIMLRDWLIHLYGLVILPLTILPSIYLWKMFLDLTNDEALIVAVTIAFTGHFFISFFIIIQFLNKR